MFRGAAYSAARSIRPIKPVSYAILHNRCPILYHGFHTSRFNAAIKPFILADIGEGIKECEVIQWFVEPGASVEEFDPICEVQSDKASVEITSRYQGVIKKLHYEPGQMALVGKPLVDIDIPESSSSSDVSPDVSASPEAAVSVQTEPEVSSPVSSVETPNSGSQQPNRFKSLATPAVRRLCKEHSIEITSIDGTGKDGRVLKEDVLNVVKEKEQVPTAQTTGKSTILSEETTVTLTGIQKQMFKTMTKSLQIPHFLYTDEVDLENVTKVRATINEDLKSDGLKLSYMPFFIKALSLSLKKYPQVNSRVHFETGSDLPSIVNRPQHNIGVAMDTPLGLIVPNIKNVQDLSILDIGRELSRLQEAGKQGKLTKSDLTGGTITLSNIGTVGGTYVGPVIVESEVAIGGLGKIRTLPRYDSNMNIIPKKVLNTSWSGDHRVLDGVTMARMVDQWKSYVENPQKMFLYLS